MKAQNLSYSMKLPVNRGNVSAGSAGAGRGRAAQQARVRRNEAARRSVLARRRAGGRARGVTL